LLVAVHEIFDVTDTVVLPAAAPGLTVVGDTVSTGVACVTVISLATEPDLT